MINRAKISGTVVDRSEPHRQILIVRVKRIFKNKVFCKSELYKFCKKHLTPLFTFNRATMDYPF